MNKNNNSDKKRIWTYAIVLFTGAFAVLLITAFSQIKLNKNISDYKSQLSSVEKKKVNFQINLNTALEENKALLKKIDQMKKDITKKNKELNVYKGKESSSNDKLTKLKHSYEVLLEAEGLYKKNDLIGSAELLFKQCPTQFLDVQGLEQYNFLVGRTFYQAAQKLYRQGYNDYKKQNYDSAIESLQEAADLQPMEYFADDCYYFIAYSQYNKGDTNGLKNTAKILLTKYPESNYISEVNELLK